MSLKKYQAFTLIELLIVISIISVLSSILFPVFTQARRSARQTSSLSNIRQCGMSLRMYMEDYSTDSLPSLAIARSVLKSSPTCDLEDNWRQSCSDYSRDPLIGSYAYAGGVAPFDTEEGWDWYRTLGNQNPTLLLSIFYADQRVKPFTGKGIDPKNCSPDFSDCRMPTRVIRVRLDGSASTSPVQTHGEGSYLMTWNLLFVSDPHNNPKGVTPK